MKGLSVLDAAAVAGHYGSISIVTFVAATSVLQSQGIASEGYLVAVAEVMEAPAILSALWLAARFSTSTAPGERQQSAEGLWREILFNGSIVLLIGSFAIGFVTGPKGLSEIESFIVSPFKGVLCLFLLDMGLVAGRGLRASARQMTPGLIFFGVLMPVLGAAAGLGASVVGGRNGASDDLECLRLLYCRACGHAGRPAGSKSIHLSHHVAWNNVSVQSDAWNSALSEHRTGHWRLGSWR